MLARIVIAKRGRDERLATCLHYLSAANAAGRHAVEVLVIDDSPQPASCDAAAFPGIRLRYRHRAAEVGAPFSRAALLNAGVEAPGAWDWCGVLDLDMIVCADYFDRVAAAVAGGYVCLQGSCMLPIRSLPLKAPLAQSPTWPYPADVQRCQSQR